MKYQLLVALACTSLFISGCMGGGSSSVKKQSITQMKRVALVSLTLDKVGDGPSNEATQKKALEYASRIYKQHLSNMPGWKLVSAPNTQEIEKQFFNLPSSKAANDTLLQLADRSELPGNFDNTFLSELTMAALSGNNQKLTQLKTQAIKISIKELQQDLTPEINDLFSAKGTAIVPRKLNKDLKKQRALSTIRDRILEEYRIKNNLDGIILVHMTSSAGWVGTIRVIAPNNRMLSNLKLDPEMRIRGRNSEIAYYSGAPRTDDLAPMKSGLPIYTYKVKNKVNKDIKLDMNDPNGKVLGAYKELINETSKKLISEFLQEMRKPG